MSAHANDAKEAAADSIAHRERRGEEVCELREVLHALKVACVAAGREKEQRTRIACVAFGVRKRLSAQLLSEWPTHCEPINSYFHCTETSF